MNKKVKKAVEFCKKHKRKIATVAIFGLGVVVGVKLNDIKYKDAVLFKKEIGNNLKQLIEQGSDAIYCTINTDDIGHEQVASSINELINKGFDIEPKADFIRVKSILFIGNEK